MLALLGVMVPSGVMVCISMALLFWRISVARVRLVTAVGVKCIMTQFNFHAFTNLD